ncbi:MAG: 3-hydroxyacyl-CoA dehydrogenase NAD-binding domain-containing protein [Proteobacteria bacterium]|nr:3-hydroxyacyl-CoA dehydrogenase NAD-binding domain-containing protein [Pseudomonadota bacterium]
MYRNLNVAIDTDGIATITIDVPGRPMNVFTPELTADLDAAINALRADSAVRGLLVTSGKSSFIAGADIKDIVTAYDRHITARVAYQWSQTLSQTFRRLETIGKPVAAAINGVALGGGLELTLACHYRVLADDPKAMVGLPEVKIGLLPGAGGTARLPRLIGITAAAKLMTDGSSVSPAEALKMGLVHELAPRGEVVARARAWLLGKPDATAPWDRKGFRMPGGAGLTNGAITQAFSIGTALVTKSAGRNYPAPGEILSALYEGTTVPFDLALKVESKHFARLLTGPVARNLMRTLFVNKGELDKLSRRPPDEPKLELHRLCVLGAGMMGAGIAHVAALAGVEVVLIDATDAQAARGKAHAEKQLARDVEKGRRTAESAAQVLARITATSDYAAVAGCQLAVEAVFEDRAVKAEVTRRALEVLPKDAIFASNTSTLPITGLAGASPRPAQFIGIHFFSPVERMPLVEIILGKKTRPATLARALDFVGMLKKTPIVVNDSRGFYTTRVFGAYCHEGQAMLAEGVDPALIENAGRLAGMPVGPLAVTDEVSLELQYRATRQAADDLGERFVPPVSMPVLTHFVEDLQRLGRKSGGGFYDYPTDGPKRLWPGLAAEYPRAPLQPTAEQVKQRLLHIQALEAARCFEEGVVMTVAEADVGSILGVGFPAWTGGTLSYIDTLGVARFVSECEKLARTVGKRFKPPRGLKARAVADNPFHPRPAPGDAA